MYSAKSSRLFDLAPQTLLPLTRAPGRTVHCRMGVIWITEQGQAGDHFLRAGQTYVVRGTGLVVIEAFSVARIEYAVPRSRVAQWCSDCATALLSALRQTLKRSPRQPAS